MEFIEWVSNELTGLAEAFGEKMTDERQDIYCGSLADLPKERLRLAFRRALFELKWFPKIAELRDLAGVALGVPGDGRPGPEEAWAKMPKGERIEEDTVVWCEEERAAYGACRTLLRDGDQIAARMAFKERYERELVVARSQGTPVRWTISAGYDVEHRLSVLVRAVEEKQLTLDQALTFVPDQRRREFSQMLPNWQSQGLLVGTTTKALPEIPGLPGLLAKLRMESDIPEELKLAPSAPCKERPDLSTEDIRRRREELRAQIELIKRSRNGSALGKKVS